MGSDQPSVKFSVDSVKAGLPGREGLVIVTVDVGAEKPLVYAIGGSGPGVEATDVFQLDGAQAGQWTRVAVAGGGAGGGSPAAVPRSGHAAAAVKRSIFVFGGRTPDGTLLDSVLELDTEAGEWKAPALEGEGPPPRHSWSAATLGDLIILFGGKSENTVHNDVYVLDVPALKWVVPAIAGVAPSPRFGHAATVCGSEVLISGGFKDHALGDLWSLKVEERGPEGLCLVWRKLTPKGTPFVPQPVVICGPSGVGKGTLINKLMKKHPEKCGFSVSHTTRKPREGELDGVHYHFTTREVMEAEVAAGKFLEHADVHGNMYGTSVAAVSHVVETGKMCILDIDVQGAQQVKKSPLQATFIFVNPPSYEELESRLRGRGTETEAAIQKRLANARAELEKGRDQSLFDYAFVNDDLERAFAQLEDLLGLSDAAVANGGIEDLKVPVVVPSARWSHAAISLGDCVLLHGGAGSQGEVLEDMHVLKRGPGGAYEWLPATSVAAFAGAGGRQGHAAIGLSADTGLVIGGKNDSEFLESCLMIRAD